ncbi:CKLF-like MARVEL transmembrane domain-containing protein 4 isoform X2 [Leptinotarsa decemlineata]
MVDPGFPGQHTTTTTVQTSSTTVETSIRFDPFYIRQLPGMLKCAEVVVNLIGFICIEASGFHAESSRGTFFNTVAMTGFWFTGILLALYLFHIVEKLYKIPWVKIEFVFCALWTGLYLIASSLAIAYHVEAYIAAGFFGFCGMVLYGIDAFIKFQAIKNGQLAQGERVISKQTTTISRPAY